MDVDWNAATVVDDRHALVGVHDHLDLGAVTGQCFVDGVVDHLEHHVVQTGAVFGVADIHAGPFAHGIQALENGDAGGIVTIFVGGHAGLHLRCFGHKAGAAAEFAALN